MLGELKNTHSKYVICAKSLAEVSFIFPMKQHIFSKYNLRGKKRKKCEMSIIVNISTPHPLVLNLLNISFA
jgi:hypothetical protein